MGTRRSAVLRAISSSLFGVLGGVIAFAVLRANVPPLVPAAVPVAELELHADDPLLDREVDAVDFENVKISDAVNAFARSQKLEIVWKWDSLKSCQFDPDKLITLHLQKIAVGRVLDHLLASDAPTPGAGWLFQNGVVTVAWQQDLDSYGPIVERLYDVRPLMMQAQQFTLRFARTRDWRQRTQWNQSALSTVVPGSSYFGDELSQVDDIIRMLTTAVSQESWRDNGGDVGFCKYVGNGKLLVHQSENAHLKIQRLLTLLESEH